MLNISLSTAMIDASDGGCGGRLDFAPMHAIRFVGQCDVNIPSLLPRGSRSKAVANDWTLNPIISKRRQWCVCLQVTREACQGEAV